MLWASVTHLLAQGWATYGLWGRIWLRKRIFVAREMTKSCYNFFWSTRMIFREIEKIEWIILIQNEIIFVKPGKEIILLGTLKATEHLFLENNRDHVCPYFVMSQLLVCRGSYWINFGIKLMTWAKRPVLNVDWWIFLYFLPIMISPNHGLHPF